MSSSLAENQKRTAQQFIDGYHEMSVEALLQPRADNCIHAMLPASLNRPDRTNEEYKHFINQAVGLFSEFRVEILKVINDPEQHMAAVHARGFGETPVGPYKNEYTFFLTFNEDGTKVTRVEEFVDSAFVKEYFVKLAEWQKAKESASQEKRLF